MKPIQTAMLVLATMTGVQSAPAADANIVIPDSSMRSEYHTSWVEDSTRPWLRKRARGKGDPCDPGRGQCVTGLGCYGCSNHQPVCQRGPGSNECCHRDNLSSVVICDRS
ncbi:hypothetical protein CH063_11354 [Colletotrichum higginsianum]|uniref:Uncharacterized protein n=2 Tax=Colletotrichum higginsianum TaxID=80884 RepID=H1VL12_COLHI|nr:hypothetical protein CH63R_11955 [Colletotrichum higginsianum IMI 349063]OBR05252.1 hypothetical protein CH63R_11955 [Colletotrichum higginsianum IMI 349063]TIC93511.1 hypothetical protein CH35J_009636 [Colletotrichum higginsianum]CCF40915.1 hypothetical protein CH063_11354 [Colletotrichum higginsianum]